MIKENKNLDKDRYHVNSPDIKSDINPDTNQRINQDIYKFRFSKNQLQEGIIWSEVLGKPKCKQRKRRTKRTPI